MDLKGLIKSGADSNWSLLSMNKVCTTSNCGKYFLTAAGSELYTYRIERNTLRLCSRTSCERNILAISISDRAEQLAVAVLLEGRIGLCLDMNRNSKSALNDSPWERHGFLINTAPETAPIMDLDTGDATRDMGAIQVGELEEGSANVDSNGEHDVFHQSVEITVCKYFHGSIRARSRGLQQMPVPSNGVWPKALNFYEPIPSKTMTREVQTKVAYRNICTVEDPPRSVAISPTRHCVAFGCRAGVELYWVC